LPAPTDPGAGSDPALTRRRRVLFAAALVCGIGLLILPVLLTDGRELWRRATSIDPLMIAVPLILTFASYAAMSLSYQGIAEAASCRLSLLEWMRITVVSNSANYLVTSAGLSGFAVRMYLLAQRGVPSGRAVLISLVQTFLTNFTLLFFILVGFGTVVVHGSITGVALGAAAAVVVVFAGILAWAVVLIVHRRLRRRTLFFIADAGHRILRRVVPRWTPGRVRLWRFQHNLNEGLEFLLARKQRILAPAVWILIDWVLTLAVLWSAFWAVGYPIDFGVVVIGFAVGICLSLVSIVPAGLGVMDSSMWAVFVGLDVPADSAVIAVLIFRIAYYLLPLLVSVFFFRRLMTDAVHGMTGAQRPRFDTPLPPPI
jgi:uncharacterized protein (TIRG00374 family)